MGYHVMRIYWVYVMRFREREKEAHSNGDIQVLYTWTHVCVCMVESSTCSSTNRQRLMGFFSHFDSVDFSWESDARVSLKVLYIFKLILRIPQKITNFYSYDSKIHNWIDFSAESPKNWQEIQKIFPCHFNKVHSIRFCFTNGYVCRLMNA